jgi:hypothetical protein
MLIDDARDRVVAVARMLRRGGAARVVGAAPAMTALRDALATLDHAEVAHLRAAVLEGEMFPFPPLFEAVMDQLMQMPAGERLMAIELAAQWAGAALLAIHREQVDLGDGTGFEAELCALRRTYDVWDDLLGRLLRVRDGAWLMAPQSAIDAAIAGASRRDLP